MCRRRFAIASALRSAAARRASLLHSIPPALAILACGCSEAPPAPDAESAPDVAVESAPMAEPPAETAAAPVEVDAPAPPEPDRADAATMTAFAQNVPATTTRLELVPVPGGTVTMPDGQTVEVAPFYMGRTEITWDTYDVFVYKLDEPRADADAIARPSKPYISMDRGFGHEGYPAISVAHQAAEAFCGWLSKHSGRRYRLPTEAEWRHACARGDIDPAALGEHAWYADNAEYTTHPAGTKAPDALGLHDLYGNASEWCRAADGQAVTLGGAYFDPADRVGCDAREVDSPDWNASDPQIPKSVWWLADGGFVGFRVVCDP